MPEQPRSGGIIPLKATVFLVTVVFGCAIYANLVFFVSPRHYVYFPPFRPYQNHNWNKHLGGEYFNIARALTQGEGFAHPFKEPTGPTAWQPPVLPVILAAILWAADGSRDAAMSVVVFLQTWILVGTGLLVVALVGQTAQRIGPGIAAVVFVLVVLWNFHMCFQFTHDGWIVILAFDLLIAGLCWWRPLTRFTQVEETPAFPNEAIRSTSSKHEAESNVTLRPLRPRWTAAVWGVFGGMCAMINPVVGMCWGVSSAGSAYRHRTWSRFAIAVLFAALTLAPWTIRNYLVFGRWIPTKSNLAYELYQSQCLQTQGLLKAKTFRHHPYAVKRDERLDYDELGEIAFLDRKWQHFADAVRADPWDFATRVGDRFLGATIWYVSFQPEREARRPWLLWLERVVHPLPFMALLLLAVTGFFRPLSRTQRIVMAVYIFYLMPYICISYYERYALPLLAVKTLLLIWAADRLLLMLWPKDNLVVSVPAQSQMR